MADELERRVRTLEEELNGERHLTRYAAEQARRGTEAFLGLRAETAAFRADTSQLRADIAITTAHVDALAENMAAINTTLVRHGRALDVLLQDVRELRSEATVLRHDMAAINARLDGLQREVQQLRGEGTALRRDMEAINDRLDGLQQDVRELRGGQDELRVRINQMQVEAAARHAEVMAAIRTLGGGSPPA